MRDILLGINSKQTAYMITKSKQQKFIQTGVCVLYLLSQLPRSVPPCRQLSATLLQHNTMHM